MSFVIFAPQLTFAADIPVKTTTITVTAKLPTGVATEAYSGSVTASGGTAPYIYKASGLPFGLSINNNSGAISGTTKSYGQFSFTVFITDANGKFGNGAFNLTMNEPPVSVTVVPLTISVPSSGTQQFKANVLYTTNTAVTWSASVGTIDANGVYTAPIETSNTSVTVTAVSAADTTKSASAAVTVLSTIVVSGNLPTGVATEAYTGGVSAAGGTAPYVYKASGLPQGLTLDNNTGAISGTSASSGQFSFAIYVTDAAGKFGKGTFSITFSPAPVSISVSPTTVGVPSGGSQQFLATVLNTTNTSVTWTTSKGTISSTGSFVAPAVTKNTPVTITATSAADTTKTASATVTVSTTSVAPVALELLFPPTSPFQPYYADVQTYLLNNPTVAGVSFWLEWGTVDKGPTANPQYDFSTFDAQIAPWIAVGKKVNIIVWAVSDTPTNNATPAYVMTNLGSSNITTCSGEKIPNYFQSAFQLPYEAFMAQVIKHYESNGSIGYIRIGLGRGGETFPAPNFGTDPCTNTFVNNWGWTDTNWTNYVNAMLDYENTLKSPKQMGVGIDSVDSNTMPISEAATAVSLKFGFGNQGFELSDITNYPYCSSDWCNLFDQYAGQVPLELQTIALSDPTNNPPVGSLVNLLPFALSHHATVFEIYTDDWLLAFDPNYPGYSTYGSAYATAFKAAAQGK